MAWEPNKPSDNEDEYFARRDAAWLRERRDAMDAERATREHSHRLMKCPRCGGQLAERAFQHVTADVCQACSGVWLDAGELEMIAQIPREELVQLARDVGGP